MTTTAGSMIGQILGGHRVLRKIGEGGMGVVYEAEHLLLGRRVAVKCLLPHLSRDAELCRRFFMEARAAALISHPGLVDIFDSGHTVTGVAYLIMELLEGETLGAVLRRCGQIDVPFALSICSQIASALGAVHAMGIVHRDLKPDNLFLFHRQTVRCQPQRVKILDFGIAKLNALEAGRLSARTRTGMVLGTPSYMSPEQCRGHGKVDTRSDIYALGCILQEMLTGHPPFRSCGYGDMLAQHIYEPPPRLRTLRPGIPSGVEELVLGMLAKTPEARIQSMEKVLSALETLTPPAPMYIARPEKSPGQTQSMFELTPITTLRAAAAEPRAATPTPRRLAGVAALLAAALVTIGVVALDDRDRPVDSNASVNVIQRTPFPAASDPDAAVAGVPDREEADDPGAAPEAPEGGELPKEPSIGACGLRPAETTAPGISISIRSLPSGAIVVGGGKRLGVTPLFMSARPCRGEFVVTVRRNGYEPRALHIPGNANTGKTVSLRIAPLHIPR